MKSFKQFLNEKGKSMTYSIKQHNDTKEIHVFDNSDKEPLQKSICKHVQKTDCNGVEITVDEVEFQYGKAKFGWISKKVDCTDLGAEELRFIASTVGRGVCGTCISHLYETEDD